MTPEGFGRERRVMFKRFRSDYAECAFAVCTVDTTGELSCDV